MKPAHRNIHTHWHTLLQPDFSILVNTVGKAMAPHSSTLAWQIPWTEDPGRLQSLGLLEVGHNWMLLWVTKTKLEFREVYTMVFIAAAAAKSLTSVVSDSVRLQRQQPTRLPCPWDSPGKNTGVGCHFLLQCIKVKSESEVPQLCPTSSNPRDCSLPGSSVHGICQARVLEWVAIAFEVSVFLFKWILLLLKCFSYPAS